MVPMLVVCPGVTITADLAEKLAFALELELQICIPAAVVYALYSVSA